MDSENKQTKQEEQMERLLKKNLAVSQEILGITRYIKRYIFWRKIIGLIQVLIILVPIVLGIIYLPPMIEKGVESINSNLTSPISNIINSNCENGQ